MPAESDLQAEDARKREENLEKAKSVVLEQDPSLPPAIKVTLSLLLTLCMLLIGCCVLLPDQDQGRGRAPREADTDQWVGPPPSPPGLLNDIH